MLAGIRTFGGILGASQDQIELNMIEWRKRPVDAKSLISVMPNLSVDSFIGLIDGLQYIRDNSIMHRDLKLENIMYKYSGNWKICDFSISRIHHTSHTTFDTDSLHVAPEQGLEGDGSRINFILLFSRCVLHGMDILPNVESLKLQAE